MNTRVSHFRIDEKVFKTMVLTAVLSFSVLAFRFKSAEPCNPVKLAFDASNFYEGVPISFRVETKGGKTFEWDFGDHKQQFSKSATITHIYNKEGTYMVTVLVNGRCNAWQNITIRKAPSTYNKSIQPAFLLPDSAVVGKPTPFKDLTPDATSWEWMFGESGKVDATLKAGTYIFKNPGVKTVYLKINGNSERMAVHTIFVKDEIRKEVKAPEEKPRQPRRSIPSGPSGPEIDIPEGPIVVEEVTPKKGPEISEAGMAAALKEVVGNRKVAADFTEFLCGNLNMPVFYNNRSTNFLQMCSELKNIRERRLRDIKVNITKNGSTGCVLSMNVVVTKSLL